MKNRKYKIISISCGLVVIVILGLVYWSQFVDHVFSSFKIDENKTYLVSQVIDGDTIKVISSNREFTVRLLGINTPETIDPRKPPECFGFEASEETKHLLHDHVVRLKTNPDRELVDKYGRYLLYVYLDDGLLINQELIRKGFAREYTFGKPYSLQKEFKQLEKEAKKSKIGLWGKCAKNIR